MSLKNRISIDVPSEVISRSFAGVAVPTILVPYFTARDILDCEVVFTAGATNITETVLPDGSVLRLGLRLNLGEGVSLAQSTPHTIQNPGTGNALASCKFSLNTTEINTLMTSLTTAQKVGTKVWFEVEVAESSATDAPRQTIVQQQFTLTGEGNMEGDEPPATAAVSAANASASAAAAAVSAALAATALPFVALTSLTALRGLATIAASATLNTIRFTWIGGVPGAWILVAGTNLDDGANFIRGADYDGTRVWAKFF